MNTPKVQDLLEQSFINYLNIRENTNLKIDQSYFNIKGEVVFSEVLLSDNDLDTILYLESIRTNFLPLITNFNSGNSLTIDGLNLLIDSTQNEIEFKNDSFKEITNNLFFDELILSNSNIIVNTDSLQNFIKIENLTAKEINNINGLSIKLNNFSGKINKTQVDKFNSEVTYKNNSFNFINSNLESGDQFIKGDIKFELDSKNQINSFQESFFEFYLESNNFKKLEQFFGKESIIAGEVLFSGLKDDITVEKFNFKTDLIEFKSKVYLQGSLSNDFNVSIDLFDINIDEESLSRNMNISQDFTLPTFDGNIKVDNDIINYSFYQQNKYNSKINIDGTATLKNQLSLDFDLVLDLLNDDKFVSANNLDNLKLDSRFSIRSNNEINFEADFQITKNNQYFDFDINTYTVNNYLSSNLEIRSNNFKIDSEIYGNLKNKKLNSSGNIFIENLSTADINNINAKTDLKIDYSNMDNVQSSIDLKEIIIETSNNSIYFPNLNEVNKILGYDFLYDKRDHDFYLRLVDNQFNLKSDFGPNLLINGFYRNSNNLDLSINFSNLFLKNLFEINKNPISGSINSKININRSDTNRILNINSSLKNLKIKEFNLGDLEINAFGNTDFNSYSIDFKLLQEDTPTIESDGTLIAINKKPNLDLDLKFNDFDLSFIEKIGSNTLNKISSLVSGQVNLWGAYDNIQHNGKLFLNKSKFFIPYLNIEYLIDDNSEITLLNQNIEFNDISISDSETNSISELNGKINHLNYKDWNLDLIFKSDRLFIINKEFDESEKFYGKAFIGGEISILGPTNQISLNVNGETELGTYITIPQNQSFSIENFSFIEFSDLNNLKKRKSEPSEIIDKISNSKSFDLEIDLTLNNDAVVDITIDQETGSYISGSGNGNLFMEIDSDGEFNIYGDFITTEGVYNFKDLALIDKKFKLNNGGTIIWDGEPLGAQMDISAIYEVPGGANPALLLDNPNFNKKIPTNLEIKLTGNLTKPNSPDFEIYFPNTSSTVTSEINYKLNDPEVRQLQAISLLTQGIFINEVSVSIEGITNNIYEKVSDVFSELLGGSRGPLKVGLNYLQGDKSEILDIKTEDRFGVTLSTEISDKILFNGKIGVPIGGIEETLIIGDVQIDFILNDDGSLKAKVFNRENEFRYIGDKLGYTQGVGVTYQVDFQTFRDLISKLIEKNK